METIEDIRKLPMLEDTDIHIWGVQVSALEDRLAGMQMVLDEKERQKAARFRREADRASSIAARGALRILLSGYTGTAAGAIEFDYSKNGKPHVAGSEIDFNVSHSGEWVVLAFGHNRQIGVDIEQVKQSVDVHAIAARYFTATEKMFVEEAADPHAVFFQLWARKEAYVKACGSTLFSELRQNSVPLEDGAERGGWFFHYLEAGSKYAAAVVTDRKLASLPCYDFGGLEWRS